VKKGFYLSSCSTCKRIIKEINFPSDLEWIDIKENPINEKDLDAVRSKMGSYEALFSKRAVKYAETKPFLVDESAYRERLLKEYTFLKRPVIVYDDFISVGNDAKTIQQLTLKFSASKT
jgi:arsenate reductase